MHVHAQMTTSPMVVTRPMQEQDVDAVMALEEICFPTPWSRDMYVHEIAENPYGSYWVLAPMPSAQNNMPPLLAYGGIWLIGDEVHITTLASHPDWRRRGYAGQLLLHLLTQARNGGAVLATLEARTNNAAAVGLYAKLGFESVGVRKGYYADTNEDALLLTLFDLDTPAVWARLEAMRAEFEAQAV
ncbi:MAG: ribosomal protein S18-alanine N-acetyltransferase [Litorilinea sp.]